MTEKKFYGMKNDYMFKAVLQENQEVLAGALTFILGKNLQGKDYGGTKTARKFKGGYAENGSDISKVIRRRRNKTAMRST